MPELMAVLYRPIVEEKNNIYTIEAYDGDIIIRTEEMKKMVAEQVQSALVFFWSFVSVLCLTLQSFSMEVLKETKEQLPQNPLPTSGVGSE